MKKNLSKIEFLNEIDMNEINPNLEYNLLIVGKEGKLIIKQYNKIINFLN